MDDIERLEYPMDKCGVEDTYFKRAPRATPLNCKADSQSKVLLRRATYIYACYKFQFRVQIMMG